MEHYDCSRIVFLVYHCRRCGRLDLLALLRLFRHYATLCYAKLCYVYTCVNQ